ncbi:HlyC/CorC family transporter [Candidatus Peregrinibacteria bacterium]|nr:HlyC/CorC family transporter [Candidatus Peregrinibacteria bacterium]
MVFKILFLALLLALSAIFSASEIAIVSITPSKVRELITKKKRGAKSVELLKKHPQKFLITILIGNNMVNTGAAVFATLLFTELFGSDGAGIAVGVMTFLILVFGEITPKSLAHRYSTPFSLFIARFILILEKILFPCIWLLEKLLQAFMKFTGSKGHAHIMTEDEIMAMVSLGEEAGALEKHEKELIENILEFNDIAVKEVMTPRRDIKALPLNTSMKKAARYVAEHMHSRFPVYKDHLDAIVGILGVKEILEGLSKSKDDIALSDIALLPVIRTSENKKIHHLFKDFQKKRAHMAVVVDEHDATVGVVTMEDLLEEIVGEIEDEYDT